MTPQHHKKLSQAVGALVARARSQAGMTLEDVAEALDVGAETVSRIERGAVAPTLARLFDFAELFDCRVDELLLEASDRSADQAAAIAQQISSLAPADPALVAALVEQLAAHLRKKRPTSANIELGAPAITIASRLGMPLHFHGDWRRVRSAAAFLAELACPIGYSHP